VQASSGTAIEKTSELCVSIMFFHVL
jgi:hypothetical protein